MDKKVCSKCKIEKFIDEFYLRSDRLPGRTVACCKLCKNHREKEKRFLNSKLKKEHKLKEINLLLSNPDNKKTCRTCNEYKSVEGFSISKRSGNIKSQCKKCERLQAKKYRELNIDKAKRNAKLYREFYIKRNINNLDLKMPANQKCYQCKRILLIEQFPKSKDRKSLHMSICNHCIKETRKTYNITKFDSRISTLRQYNLSLEDYQKLLNQQNNVCAICFKTNKKRKNLTVDHSHETNKVRGLLCITCNLAISRIEHDSDVFESLIEYYFKKIKPNYIDQDSNNDIKLFNNVMRKIHASSS